MQKYGYIRVSTKDQHTDRQHVAMKACGLSKENVFCDCQSGKDFSRPAYRSLLKKIHSGDLLVVKSIDRLGRNYTEILKQWQYITKELHADIYVIDMPLLDTRKRNCDLTGTFIADLVLQILAYVAETERSFIRQRQAEGIHAAKVKGVRFGRKPFVIKPEFDQYYRQWINGNISLRTAAREIGVSYSTFYRWCKMKKMSEGSNTVSES